MRRVSACALWILLLGCSASGEGDGPSSVIERPSNGGAGPNVVDPGPGGSTGVNPGGSGNIFDPEGCTNGCAFPIDPLLAENVTAADIAVFPASGDDFQPGSFCVVEPQLSNGATPGALFPRNWLRPRFRWASTTGETLWEVRLTNPDQPDPLRAYTRETEWTLPQEIWVQMRTLQKPTTVTIRGVGANGVVSGVKGDFTIAPVDAGGSMVFWSTSSSYVSPTSSRLLGFAVGNDGVVPTLTATQVQTDNIPGEDGATPRGYYACSTDGTTFRPPCTSSTDYSACCDATGFEQGQVECVGCHVSTPDGKAVIFTDNWPWNKVAASIEPGLTGSLPDTVTAYAASVMKQPWLGMQALSPAHFSATERILVTSYGDRGADPSVAPFTNTPPVKHGLAWFNLAAEDPDPETVFPVLAEENFYGPDQNARQVDVREGFGTAWGMLATGETLNAVTPSWSNDGNEVAYVSTSIASTDGHPDWTANDADIKVVPYNNRAGGAAVPLAGASDPGFLEYYPEYSADDAFIAFARAPNPTVATRCIPTQRTDGSVQPCTGQTLATLGENPDGPYYNRNGEIYIVPRAGGTPIRLAANDPVSCTGETARGSINSWPRWSPRVEASEDGQTKYYFLIFSSARAYPGSFNPPTARLTPEISNKSSQLYMAPIVVAGDGTVTTYPAIYLWNQNIVADGLGGADIQQSSNLTPAWDDFSIPEVPPITLPPR